MTRDTVTDPRRWRRSRTTRSTTSATRSRPRSTPTTAPSRLYAWDDKDPILQDLDARPSPASSSRRRTMSPELLAHLRYPEDLFKVQRDVLSQYHITDPNAFYSGQDFWNVPNDPSRRGSTKQPPYYLSHQDAGDLGRRRSR